jgi:succinylarginine dihydrolase
VFFVEQDVSALNEGAFHNDVIATANQSVLFCHEAAYRNGRAVKGKLKRACPGLQVIEVSRQQLPLKEAVDTYIFNSQLISDGQGMVLVAAADARRSKRLTRYLKTLVADPRNPITRVEYVDVGQSAKNGGGPACLRLRVVLTDTELQSVATNGRVLLDDALHTALTAWVDRHYRDRVVPMDLCDPNLIEETRAALDELTQILRLGSVYRFQSEARMTNDLKQRMIEKAVVLLARKGLQRASFSEVVANVLRATFGPDLLVLTSRTMAEKDTMRLRESCGIEDG